jgi:hypothetical protein
VEAISITKPFIATPAEHEQGQPAGDDERTERPHEAVVEDGKMEAEKSKEKIKSSLIFLSPEPASDADLPKFYKKRGRQRTEVKTKALILYRLERRKWPHGLSDYMCWYYDTNYLKRGSKFYGKTEQWKAEIKRSKIHIVSADHSA